MSRTMFWYIMRDLLRIFLMTSGVLAGIMSFGGLIKPMMQYGLNGTQVVRMLAYFMPAMMSYSLPISALFATTMVYGRMSADNELTACRATGMSYLSLTVPAFVLGLILSLVSLASLLYIVPLYTLKAEKLAFSSLADLVDRSIQRSHQIKLEGYTIYADHAEVLPPEPGHPDQERVMLYSPMFCYYDQVAEPNGKSKNIPSDFFTARYAIAEIRQDGDEAEFRVHLEDGVKLSRKLEGATTGGIGAVDVGPIPLPSLIRENTKFMNVTQLKALFRDPTRSRTVRTLLGGIIRQEQEWEYLGMVQTSLQRNLSHRFVGPDGDFYILSVEDNTRRLVQEKHPLRAVRNKSKLALQSAGAGHDLHLLHVRNNEVLSSDQARLLTIRSQVDPDNSHVMRLAFDLEDVVVKVPEGTPSRQSLPRSFRIAMPAELPGIETRDPNDYLRKSKHETAEVTKLRRKLMQIHNGVQSELHGRASFAVSCLILVVVGCSLGMMFRTGNFLNAFALSVIPALACIALVVTGEHVSENGLDSLKLGLGIIWTGNVLVLALATTLLWKLQRQ